MTGPAGGLPGRPGPAGGLPGRPGPDGDRGLDVEISIVNHENREMLRSCLLSLPAACPGIAWHATVIDNLSNDGSLEMLAAEFGHVGVIANPVRLGFGANHNQVLRRLVLDRSAAFALILNDDAELQAGAVTRMVGTMRGHPGLGGVVPSVVDGRGRPSATRLAYPTARSALHTDRTDITELPDPERGWLQGCCLLLRVDAVRDVGPFDERFFLFYEDVDLSLRLVRAGWSLGECPEARVVHYGHATVLRVGIAETTPKQGLRSRYLYFAKHSGRPQAEIISLAGRSVLLARGLRAAAGAGRHRDPVRLVRARRLLGLARFNPRRPLPQERQAAGAGLLARSSGASSVGRASRSAGRKPRWPER